MRVFSTAFYIRWKFIIDKIPSAAFDSAQRRAGTVIGQPLGPEAAPIVGYDLIQCGNHVIEGVRLHHGSRAGSAVEEMAKVVEGFRALALLAEDDVDPQPIQSVFVVEVGAATPGFPGMRREIKLRSIIRGVLQVAPGSARSVIESGGGQS